MDIGKSFSYIFEDDSWVNRVLVGGVVSLIPIVNLATIGYSLRTIKNVAAGEARPLPAWDEFGDYLAKGIVAAVAMLVYALPILLLVAVTTLVSALGANGGERDALSGIVALCVTGVSCLMGLYGLFLGLWLPAATVRYAQTETFGSFFRFGEIWGFMSRRLGGYIVALLVAWVASLAASLIGSALCLVGVAFTGFVALLVYAHLMGQLAGEAPQAAQAPAF